MLFVFWELTSITSFLLIGFDHRREAARRAALQALVVTGLGGLSLLAGLLVLSAITGVGELSALLASGDAFAKARSILRRLLLVLGGAFTKSAQFPFHFWLPNAMEAPTPVSAYLHSATMVKAGVYLVMRLNPVLGDTAAWETILPVFGGATLVVGTLLAVRQTDLKLMLAYTTVGSLGLLVMLTGFGSQRAIEAAVLYLVAHAMFKGALFMVAGLDRPRDRHARHHAARRVCARHAGHFRCRLARGLSMGGLPLFFGFLAKEEIYAGLGVGETWPTLLAIVAIAGNALMFADRLHGRAEAVHRRRRRHAEASRMKAPPLLWIGPLCLPSWAWRGSVFAATSCSRVEPDGERRRRRAGRGRGFGGASCRPAALPLGRHHRAGHCRLSVRRAACATAWQACLRDRLGTGPRLRPGRCAG